MRSRTPWQRVVTEIDCPGYFAYQKTANKTAIEEKVINFAGLISTQGLQLSIWSWWSRWLMWWVGKENDSYFYSALLLWLRNKKARRVSWTYAILNIHGSAFAKNDLASHDYKTVKKNKKLLLLAKSAACYPLSSFGQKRRSSVAFLSYGSTFGDFELAPVIKGDRRPLTSKSKTSYITGWNTFKTFKIRPGDSVKLPLVLCFTLGNFLCWTSRDCLAPIEAWSIL